MVIFLIFSDFWPFFVHNFIKHFIHNLVITMWVYFLKGSGWISLSKISWKWLVNAWVRISQDLVNIFIHTYDTSKFREFSNISDAWKDVLKYMLFRVKIISQIDFTSFLHAFYTWGTSMEVEGTWSCAIRSWQKAREAD